MLLFENYHHLDAVMQSGLFHFCIIMSQSVLFLLCQSNLLLIYDKKKN